MKMVLLIMKSLINRQICLKKKTSDKLIKKHFMAQDLKLSLKKLNESKNNTEKKIKFRKK